MKTNMLPILVHAHIFYPELWGLVKRSLQNIASYPYELHVTMVKEHKSIIEDIETLKLPAQIHLVDNIGYDIAPFLYVLNKVNLDEYSYIVKMHTKRELLGKHYTLRGYSISNCRWREYLYSFLSYSNFKKCIKAFLKMPRLGMVNNFRLIYKHEPHDQRCMTASADMLRKAGLTPGKFAFVAGSMFMCRAELMKPLLTLGIKTEDFETYTGHDATTLAHIFERLLGWVVTSQGYKLMDVYTPYTERFIAFFSRSYTRGDSPASQFLFNKQIVDNKRVIVKIFGFKVYSAKI